MALTRSLNVYNGSDSTPITDVTDRTDWPGTELTSMANLGEAAASAWLMRDEGGTIPDFVAPGELIDAHNIIVATVGSNTLFRGRIATDEHFRGRQKAGRAKEITFNLEDANSHLRGMIVHEWIRPAETDAARAQALVAAYLSGSPRPTTNLNGSNLIITGSNAIALPAKTYSGVTPWEVMSELASNSDKEMFVTVDNELAYFGHDYAGYASLLRISDDPADQNATTYAPWDPHGFEFGRQKLSALRVYYGTDVTQSTIQLTNSNAPRFDYWEDVFWDSESVTAAQAEARAQKMLDYRSTDDLSYSFSIGPMSGDEIWKVKPGQSILLKARAARGGRNSDGSYTGDFFLSTRVREIAWTMPNEDEYHARIAIERPKRTQSTGSGSQPLTIMPEPAPTCLPTDPGGIGDPVAGAALFCASGGTTGSTCAISADSHCSSSAPHEAVSGQTTVTPGSYYSEVQLGQVFSPPSTHTFRVLIRGTALPDISVVLDIKGTTDCRGGGGWVTLGGVFEVPTGYNRVIFKTQGTAGIRFIKEGSHTFNEYTPPADPPENDPFCVTDGGSSPYFARTDDPRFDAVDQHETTRLTLTMTNGSGSDLSSGAVVIAIDDNTFDTTSTASLTTARVGILLDDTVDGEDGTVTWESEGFIVPSLTATTTAGYFIYTSTTPGQASTSASRTTGAVGRVVQVDADDLPNFVEWWGVPDSSGAASSLPWFIVTDYGAAGDGTTDDTAAINSAIAALNTAGKGVLYFPAGEYLCSGALTAITAQALVCGDGGRGDLTLDNAPSRLICSSATAAFFTLSADGCTVRDLALVNTAATPSAGAGIVGTGDHLQIEGVSVGFFYDNIDYNGGLSVFDRLYIRNPMRYGIRYRNTGAPDQGDHTLSDSYIVEGSRDADAAVRYESGGGLKITGLKVNGSASGSNRFDYGIDMAIPTGVNTSDLLIANSSIENVKVDGIHATTAGTGTFWHLILAGIEFALYGNNSGKAINLVAGSAGDLTDIVISANVMRTDGTARSAIQLTNVDNVTLVGNVLADNFTSLYTQTTSTNITELGAIGDILDLPTAETDTTLVLAPDGAGGVEFRAETGGATSHWEVLMTDGISNPPDPLLNEAGTDWLYGEVA